MESITSLLCSMESAGWLRKRVSSLSMSALSAAASAPSGNILHTSFSRAAVNGESTTTVTSLNREFVSAMVTMVMVAFMKLKPITAFSP